MRYALLASNLCGLVRCLVVACCVTVFTECCVADEPRERPASQTPAAPEDDDSESTGRFNLATPTLGGLQLWTDEFVYHDWRIQRNSLTDHCRLLDKHNVRRGWGTFAECQRRFAELKQTERIPPLPKRVILAIHGLGQRRSCWNDFVESMRDEPDCAVLCMSYASTRGDLTSHAESLAKVLAGLAEAREISLVGHSLGNLVIRRYWRFAQESPDSGRPDPRIRRIVMIGPPNQGANIARQLSQIPLFTQVVGPSGKQLTLEWAQVERELSTPDCEFGILAGGQGDERGLNPLIPGDDDLIVRVDETRLAGARDFRVLPCLHRQLPRDTRVHEFARQFLRSGCFETETQRQPLRSESSTSSTAGRPTP